MTDPFDSNWRQELLTVAIQAAHAAGNIHLQLRTEPLNVRSKSHMADLVTAVDVAAEKEIAGILRRATPEVSVVGEEGTHAGGEGVQVPDEGWLVDPLDGTQNYVFGLPFYSVSIAYVRGGQVQLGVIHDAVHGETFTAVHEDGSFLNGGRLRVSARATLDAPALLTTGFSRQNADDPAALKPFLESVRRGLPVRRLSSSALCLAYIAAGRIDAYWDAKLMPWDTAAGWLMVQEAGGTLSDYRGRPYTLHGPMLASNGLLHREMLELIGVAGAQ
ncbi:inositol monophosphatase family protein [Deinococcus sp.]|uniref:inositol monophosphatase family protein n=1 Tax=Deinococcus sp. TaxID=47478 RepID=UPI0025BCD228|nr:inositol monophosphatase family protein [Deinococcus sp.]